MNVKCTLPLMLVAAASAVAQPEPTTSLNGGVACVVPAGDGAKALELAQRVGWIVLALDGDPREVAELKEKAAAAGLLGRSLYVEEGTAENLPFADNYVDLLIADRATPEARICAFSG